MPSARGSRPLGKPSRSAITLGALPAVQRSTRPDRRSSRKSRDQSAKGCTVDPTAIHSAPEASQASAVTQDRPASAGGTVPPMAMPCPSAAMASWPSGITASAVIMPAASATGPASDITCVPSAHSTRPSCTTSARGAPAGMPGAASSSRLFGFSAPSSGGTVSAALPRPSSRSDRVRNAPIMPCSPNSRTRPTRSGRHPSAARGRCGCW